MTENVTTIEETSQIMRGLANMIDASLNGVSSERDRDPASVNGFMLLTFSRAEGPVGGAFNYVGNLEHDRAIEALQIIAKHFDDEVTKE